MSCSQYIRRGYCIFFIDYDQIKIVEIDNPSIILLSIDIPVYTKEKKQVSQSTEKFNADTGITWAEIFLHISGDTHVFLYFLSQTDQACCGINTRFVCF